MPRRRGPPPRRSSHARSRRKRTSAWLQRHSAAGHRTDYRYSDSQTGCRYWSIRRCWRHVGTALRSGLHEWIAVIRLRVLLIVLLISTHIRISEERITRPLRLLRSLPVRAILRLRGYVRRTIRGTVRGCGAISRLRRHGTVRTIFRCRTVLLGRRILVEPPNHQVRFAPPPEA